MITILIMIGYAALAVKPVPKPQIKPKPQTQTAQSSTATLFQVPVRKAPAAFLSFKRPEVASKPQGQGIFKNIMSKMQGFKLGQFKLFNRKQHSKSNVKDPLLKDSKSSKSESSLPRSESNAVKADKSLKKLKSSGPLQRAKGEWSPAAKKAVIAMLVVSLVLSITALVSVIISSVVAQNAAEDALEEDVPMEEEEEVAPTNGGGFTETEPVKLKTANEEDPSNTQPDNAPTNSEPVTSKADPDTTAIAPPVGTRNANGVLLVSSTTTE